jgi:HAD superfamily hydrolase (TIGR01490 family)
MNLALFDFDGTISTSDTWTPFMRLAVRPARLAVARGLLFPVAIAYKLDVLSASRGRQIAIRLGFQGDGAARVRECGVDYARKALPRTIRTSALERVDWHRSRGDEVVVVSAALEMYLGPWCHAHGLAHICTTLEEKDGRLTGKYVDGDCCGAEKVRRIRARYDLSRYTRVYAYGDSAEDREMLELAHSKFYRGREISNWNDVTSFGHPRVTSSEHE